MNVSVNSCSVNRGVFQEGGLSNPGRVRENSEVSEISVSVGQLL